MSKSIPSPAGTPTTTSLPHRAPSIRVQAEPILIQIGYYALLVWTFLYFSRLLDISFSNLKIMMILNVIWLTAAVLSGRLLALFTTGVGLALTGFFCWMVISFPFSVWKGGSVETVQLTLRALLLMASIMALVTTTIASRKLMYTMGFALAVAAVISRVSGEQSATGRLVLATGAFSDPNIYCLALGIGLPFLLLRATIEDQFYKKLMSIAAVVPMLITAVSTGSRSGFLALVAMFIVLFFRSSGRVRVYLVAGTSAAVMLVSAVASDYMLARLTTVFSSAYDDSLSEKENRSLATAAVGSANARKYLFMRSIELTLKNPIVGVGPGMFAVAEAADAQGQNIEEAWHETHNTYTQVSSEIGIPGLMFYAGGIIIAFLLLARLPKLRSTGSNDRAQYEIHQSALYLQLSLIVMATGAMFLSIAYNGLIFFLLGLTVALDRAARQELSLTQPHMTPSQPAAVPAERIRRTRDSFSATFPKPQISPQLSLREQRLAEYRRFNSNIPS